MHVPCHISRISAAIPPSQTRPSTAASITPLAELPRKMATAYSGTSGPSRWYFRVPIITCVVVLRDPHPPARHGDSADLRRKRRIGISKPHGGTSGPLNMLLWWYFETPALP